MKKDYTMPDKCHDEDCSQPIGSRWNCENCPIYDEMKNAKGPFQQLRVAGILKINHKDGMQP